MDLFLKWLALAAVQLAATMSPGPAFVISVRNAIVYNRSVGIYTALGLAIGVGAHVIFVLGGLSFIVSQSVYFYNFIKYAGAAYLLYIGIKSLIANKKKVDTKNNKEIKSEKSISSFKAFRIGFFTNLLNPKAIIFFTAVYTQFVDINTSFSTHSLYAITSIAIEFLWFAGVSVVLTNTIVKQKFMNMVHWVERGCGVLMIAFGIKLALTR